MRLLYIANIRLPTEKAHGIQIMKTCEALSGQGIAVELIVADRKNPLDGNPFTFYGVPQCFKFHRIRCKDFLAIPLFKRVGFLLQSFSFYRAAAYYVSHHRADVYYTRDLVVAFFLSRIVRPIFYEIHTMPKRVTFFHRRAWKRCAGLIVISDGLKQALLREGVSEQKILVARDAVDVERFRVPDSQEACRQKLALPRDQKIVLYAGHLYDWKGAGLLAEAAALVSTHIHVYLVGGTERNIQTFRKKYRASNLHIVGWQPQHLIPYWLKAANLLVLPNSAKEKISALYTSPLKLFEYMASGTPRILADVPSIREVAGEHGLYFRPDDVRSLANAIERELNAPSGASLEDMQMYTWQKRAHVINDFITSSLSLSGGAGGGL